MSNHPSTAAGHSRARRIEKRIGLIAALFTVAAMILSGCTFSAEDFIDALNQIVSDPSAVTEDSPEPNTSGNESDGGKGTFAAEAPVTEPFTVIRVVDGDTIWVVDDEGNDYKVRIIGVDAPETEKENQAGEPFAEEAFDFAKHTLSGRIVYLERDVSDTDQYNRLLRYVWLEEPVDGDEETFECLNFSALLVRGGYARVVAYGEDTRYESELRALENLASKDGLGMWTYS